MLSEKFYQWFCLLILSISAIISAFLTIRFMYSIGDNEGLALVFALVGFCLDSVKTFGFSLSSRLFSRNKCVSLSVLLFGLILMLISGSASVFTLEQGVNHTLKSTNAALVAQEKAGIIKKEISDLESLKANQMAVNYVTKAESTTHLISQKRAELTHLIDESTGKNTHTFLSEYSLPIIYILAVSLEILAVVMTFCLHALQGDNKVSSVETRRDMVIQVEAGCVEEVVSVGDLGGETVSVETSSCDGETQLSKPVPNVMFAAKTRQQIIEELKCALLARVCKPTHRDIRSLFSSVIKQREVKGYLSELERMGVLSEQENGTYQLAI